MILRTLSFHIAASACLLAQAVPHFTAQDAIRAEWARKAPAFTAAEKAKLSPEDRSRLDLTIRRIGQPGAPDLLPPELSSPTPEIWLAKAKAAKTPRERFDALFFLNRFKRPEALSALDGLSTKDAATWPKHLHLEAGIATARLNGAVVSGELQTFLHALQKAGKEDPVRAQAARLRLVMAGKEKDLLPPVKPTPGSTLALLDAWNRSPWESKVPMLTAIADAPEPAIPLSALGSTTVPRMDHGFRQRLFEAWPAHGKIQYGAAAHFLADLIVEAAGSACGEAPSQTHAMDRLSALQALGGLDAYEPARIVASALPFIDRDPISLASLLPSLRKLSPQRADELRSFLLQHPHAPIARAAAIDDLPAAPADLADLTKRVWADSEFEPQQMLIQSYARWKMSPEDQKAQLRPWLAHPEWACRWEAYQALKKLDAATPWPATPAPTKEQEGILREAERLARIGKPVRLRLAFEGRRRIVLRLDPVVAPVNVANLVHLARKGFFNGRHVPRVVPDFVVQMGSPYDTMDGGPGYTVRCEDSLTWFGPGSVGMALGGKDTGGSQFFITTNATPHLTGKYTRMGEVEDPDHALPLLDDLELGARIEGVEVLP